MGLNEITLPDYYLEEIQKRQWKPEVIVAQVVEHREKLRALVSPGISDQFAIEHFFREQGIDSPSSIAMREVIQNAQHTEKPTPTQSPNLPRYATGVFRGGRR